MFEQYQDVITVKEICQMLGIGRNAAYNLLKYGDIQYIRAGHAIRIPKQCVIDYIEHGGSKL